MAKKKVATAEPSKSDVIREILKANPKAGQKEVREILDERGIKASDALISKIKYGRKSTRRGRSAGASGSARGSKAAAIRDLFSQMGNDARVRDVIAILRKRGMTVSSAQVSLLRKSARGDAAQGVVPAGAVSLDQLVAAKQLVERTGSIEAARRALASLSLLLG